MAAPPPDLAARSTSARRARLDALSQLVDDARTGRRGSWDGAQQGARDVAVHLARLCTGPGITYAFMAIAGGEDRGLSLRLAAVSALSALSRELERMVQKAIGPGAPSERLSSARVAGVLASLQRRDPPRVAEGALDQAIDGLDKVVLHKVAHDDVEGALALLSLRQGAALSLPLPLIDVAFLGEEQAVARRALNARVERLVDSYPATSHTTLSGFIAQIRANSFLSQPRRAQIYLQGAPGTGKSYFVHKLAETLGLPLVTLHLKETRLGFTIFEEQEDIRWFCPRNRGEDVDVRLLGTLAAHLIKSGSVNPVVFFDEVDTAMESPATVEVLKRLCDPDLTTLPLSNVSDYPLDISRLTVIFAGNRPLSNPALRSRVRELPFGALPPASKREILRARLRLELDNGRALSPLACDRLEAATRGAVDLVVREDVAREEPGVRVACEALSDLVAHHRGAIIAEAAPLSEEAARDIVAQAFAQRSQARRGEGQVTRPTSRLSSAPAG